MPKIFNDYAPKINIGGKKQASQTIAKITQ